MSTSNTPLKPSDFPLQEDGHKVKKQDGEPIAQTNDPAVATDIADR